MSLREIQSLGAADLAYCSGLEIIASCYYLQEETADPLSSLLVYHQAHLSPATTMPETNLFRFRVTRVGFMCVLTTASDRTCTAVQRLSV